MPQEEEVDVSLKTLGFEEDHKPGRPAVVRELFGWELEQSCFAKLENRTLAVDVYGRVWRGPPDVTLDPPFEDRTQHYRTEAMQFIGFMSSD